MTCEEMPALKSVLYDLYQNFTASIKNWKFYDNIKTMVFFIVIGQFCSTSDRTGCFCDIAWPPNSMACHKVSIYVWKQWTLDTIGIVVGTIRRNSASFPYFDMCLQPHGSSFQKIKMTCVTLSWHSMCKIQSSSFYKSFHCQLHLMHWRFYGVSDLGKIFTSRIG